MIIVHGTIPIRPDCRDQALELARRMADATRSEMGCISYDFYVGPDFSHCGVDVATMMQTEAGWKIVALSWTRLQPPACALHPDGPPA